MNNQDYTFIVRVNNNNVKEYHQNYNVYIEGRRGSEYELYFKNNTSSCILVIFSVDGLGVIDGKTASNNSSGYYLNGFQSIVIPGWTINWSKVAKFQFSPQGDKNNSTYVEALKAEGFDVDVNNQGVIRAMVFKEKIKKVYYNWSHGF